MGIALESTAISPPAAALAWGNLPSRLRVLHLTASQRAGGWLAEALALDRAAEVTLVEVHGPTEGLTRLRDETFDAVLVSHEPGEIDALELLTALRAGGTEEPLVVLGSESEHDFASACHEAGADAYVCVPATTTRMLLWLVARAVERHRLIRENRRLTQAERQRLRLEHDEAQRMLDQQRRLIRDFAAPGDSHDVHELDAEPRDLPAGLVSHYRELLRAYVIMGSGNLAAELATLAEMLASADISAPRTVEMHLGVLEELVRGLGNRSARHVMARADLLVLEVIVHLSEGLRRRLVDQRHPPRQLHFHGFEASPAA
jgi:DNA-binding response OmpR family regulator